MPSIRRRASVPAPSTTAGGLHPPLPGDDGSPLPVIGGPDIGASAIGRLLGTWRRRPKAGPAVAASARPRPGSAQADRSRAVGLAPGAAATAESASAGDRQADRLAIGHVLVDRAADGSEFAGHGDVIQAVCVARGLLLVTIVRDVEVAPGDSGARPALRWALEQLAAGEAYTLVVARLGHLTDTVADLPALLRWFSEQRRTLIASDFQLDTSTEAGRLAAGALVGVGDWERERISACTRRGLEAARSRGAGRGQPAVADVPELRDRIAGMRAEGMTLQAIADVLNEQGVPTLRGGAMWRPSSVQAATGYRRPSSRAKRLDLPPTEAIPMDAAALASIHR